jgi:hypothetical protein
MRSLTQIQPGWQRQGDAGRYTQVFAVAAIARLGKPRSGDHYGVAFANAGIRRRYDMASDIDSAVEHRFAQNLAAAGAGECILVIDAAVGGLDQ